jgi:hypothetical protein
MRRPSAAVAGAVLLLVAVPASARKVSLQAQLTLSGGYSTNVLSLSPGTVSGPQDDFFGDVRPALILTGGEPRAVQSLRYEFVGNLFARRTEANSYNHRAEYLGYFSPSKVTEIFLTASLAQGRINTFNLTLASPTTPVQIAPAGGNTFVAATVSEALNWDVSPRWRFSQSLGYNSFYPLDPRTSPDAYQLLQRIAFERYFTRATALAFIAGNDILVFTDVRGPVVETPTNPDGTPGDPVVNPDGVVVPGQKAMINQLSARLRQDAGRWWNFEAQLGVVESSRIEGPSAQVWQPFAFAAARFLHDFAQVDLSYQHGVGPNLITAQVFVTDGANLRISVPFGPKIPMAAGASAGYQYARQIDYLSGADVSRVHLVLADATLAYAPRPEVSIFARYQYWNQTGDPTDLLPVPTFDRHIILIGVTAIYPATAAFVVPRRQGQRVDRADADQAPELHKPMREVR